MCSSQIISQSCSWFHRDQNYVKALAMSTLSGIGVNRLGSFQQCTEDPNFKFFLMQYKLHVNNTNNTFYYDDLCFSNNCSQSRFYTGICYSSNCTERDLIYISKSVNQYIPHHYQQLKICEPFEEYDIWNVYAILSLAILGSILICSLIMMVFKICKKYRQSNRNRANSLSQNRMILLQNKKSLFSNKLKTINILEVFSLRSSLKFVFHKSSNQDRIRIISGLRAFSFLGITLHYIIYLMLLTPSLPRKLIFIQHLSNLFYFNDIWFMVAGFYFSFQLAKNWTKQQSVKIVVFSLMRKVGKIIVVSLFCILITNAVVYGTKVGPLWTLTYIEFTNQCNFFNIFGECNFWLWIWQIQIYMSLIFCLLFLIWHAKFKLTKAAYILINILFVGTSFVMVIFYGKKNETLFSYQGNIIKCPIVGGISYLLGFNLGLLYFYFKINRNKSKLLVMRILKYKLFRISLSIFSLIVIILVYMNILYLQPRMPEKVSQFLYQLSRALVPFCYVLLIVPEMLGFQNMWGTLLKDRFMNIVSIFSFMSYSIYYLVCMLVLNNLRQDLYVNFSKVICIWLCCIFLSLLIGFGLCLVIQIPVYRTLSYIFGRNKPKGYIQFY